MRRSSTEKRKMGAVRTATGRARDCAMRGVEPARCLTCADIDMCPLLGAGRLGFERDYESEAKARKQGKRKLRELREAMPV